MHYIVGTSFTLIHNPSYQLLDKRFKYNTKYVLTNISKKDTKFVYTFTTLNGKVEAEFNSIQDAEKFISNCRKERVPVYSYQESQPPYPPYTSE
jgi:DNA topoisomerase IA